ncbi:hypothetical protein HanRHA438_Chr03g0126711 [Helianthus annuus]|nr:hypothetical protein HanIR_Chr03g0125581 [Helianthus annuus]KAJ0936072.1 hypothetical protein HanRHA438_Chr03g0126711 [Helianthus annuus]
MVILKETMCWIRDKTIPLFLSLSKLSLFTTLHFLSLNFLIICFSLRESLAFLAIHHVCRS